MAVTGHVKVAHSITMSRNNESNTIYSLYPRKGGKTKNNDNAPLSKKTYHLFVRLKYSLQTNTYFQLIFLK